MPYIPLQTILEDIFFDSLLIRVAHTHVGILPIISCNYIVCDSFAIYSIEKINTRIEYIFRTLKNDVVFVLYDSLEATKQFYITRAPA